MWSQSPNISITPPAVMTTADDVIASVLKPRPQAGTESVDAPVSTGPSQEACIAAAVDLVTVLMSNAQGCETPVKQLGKETIACTGEESSTVTVATTPCSVGTAGVGGSNKMITGGEEGGSISSATPRVEITTFNTLPVSDVTLQGPLVSLKGPLVTLQGPLVSLQGPLVSQQGSLVSLQGPLVSQQGSLASLQLGSLLAGPATTTVQASSTSPGQAVATPNTSAGECPHRERKRRYSHESHDVSIAMVT